MQLFRRDAEHGPKSSTSHGISYKQPRILAERSVSGGSGSSRDSPAPRKSANRRTTPPVSRAKEHETYGRRW